jgi:hypothetical protein
MQKQQEQSHSYLIAFNIGVKAAQQAQQPLLTGDALLLLASNDYHKASETINLELDPFLLGWAHGWQGYYNGIISGGA